MIQSTTIEINESAQILWLVHPAHECRLRAFTKSWGKFLDDVY